MTPSRGQLIDAVIQYAVVVPALMLHLPIWVGCALAAGWLQDGVEAMGQLPPLTRALGEAPDERAVS